MKWVVFSYSLPSKASSSPRVTLWRRLRRLGAVSPTGGTHVLPARGECVEGFQWLAQEIRKSHGQALVMHVEQFDGLTDQQLINLFRSARQEDYGDIASQAAELEKILAEDVDRERHTQAYDILAKLQRQYTDIARIDYFDCPEGNAVEAQLARIARALAPHPVSDYGVPPATIAAYKDRRWVTRPQPHVDRMACAWLIRRFINPDAIIRYSQQPEPGEVTFDMRDAEFGHHGNLCTFETMIRAFTLEDPALLSMAEIVHEIDLRDGRYMRLEVPGIDAVLKGWLSSDLSDTEMELRGVALFDGLYGSLAARQGFASGD